jgi:hypothetical protein
MLVHTSTIWLLIGWKKTHPHHDLRNTNRVTSKQPFIKNQTNQQTHYTTQHQNVLHLRSTDISVSAYATALATPNMQGLYST